MGHRKWGVSTKNGFRCDSSCNTRIVGARVQAAARQHCDWNVPVQFEMLGFEVYWFTPIDLLQGSKKSRSLGNSPTISDKGFAGSRGPWGQTKSKTSRKRRDNRPKRALKRKHFLFNFRASFGPGVERRPEPLFRRFVWVVLSL